MNTQLSGVHLSGEDQVSDGSSLQTVILKKSNGDNVPIAQFFDDLNNLLVVYPVSASEDKSEMTSLTPGKRYSLVLTSDITDLAGNNLATSNTGLPQDVSFQADFKTVPPEVDDDNECTYDYFDWTTESIVNENVEDEEPCTEDGKYCTDDYCMDGECEHFVQEDSCYIAQSCVANETLKPGNICFWCDPEVLQTDWSFNNGFSCDDSDPVTDMNLTFCQDGWCECFPDCDGKECGPDGCGGECGVCADGINSHGVCLASEEGGTECGLECDDNYWDLDEMGASRNVSIKMRHLLQEFRGDLPR